MVIQIWFLTDFLNYCSQVIFAMFSSAAVLWSPLWECAVIHIYKSCCVFGACERVDCREIICCIFLQSCSGFNISDCSLLCHLLHMFLFASWGLMLCSFFSGLTLCSFSSWIMEIYCLKKTMFSQTSNKFYAPYPKIDLLCGWMLYYGHVAGLVG